ncbi:BACON domain-containing carbohydrate-binding protein [uncultured Alistipes sp.]|uniref:BACON domain-containing protein n=1 Tax=uncultured Alistipes sp. TaxID=538949 RepID=UPI0026287678|nr:BACON domain-containing carbohydrate-binding protein [uncultured Alistipes sp.]
MKIRNHIATSLLAAAALLAACSTADESVAFGTDTNSISIDAVGGTKKIKVSANENWVAISNVPWITVSPANGYKSTECSLNIDSAITNTVRNGVVRIVKTGNSAEYQEIRIEQKGFDYAITLDEPTVNIENYASLDKRYFDVKVRTNVDFDVKVPDDKTSWVKFDRYDVALDHGLRPREVTIRFNWGINSGDERSAEVSFVPTSESNVTSEMLARNDKLTIEQSAAEPITPNSREGDSVALLSIARTLEVWASSWESSGEKMDNWAGVTLWEEGMEGYVDSLKGRVKAARFYMFSIKEGIPFEVKYLTAAEELEFYSNVNTFQLNLSTGPYICELSQLKRLTIGAYGLTELDENFTNLRNLEYLDLSSNNFEKIPDIINPTNFPKLHVLRMANNQRRLVYDLSNNIATNFGGLYQHTKYDSNMGSFGEFPSWLFKWEPGEVTTSEGEQTVTGLDTLILSVNYLQGPIPDFKDDESIPVYTEAPDSLKDAAGECILVKNRIKRVMPQLRMLALNLNRMTGALPDWVLYHPALDWWDPFTLLFNQEGKDEQGNLAGFSNEPANMDYYYQAYPKKKLANMTDEDDAENGDDAGTTR